MVESAAEVDVDRPAPGVAVVTYHNPAIRNHLSWDGAGAILRGLDEARDGGAHVVVLASAHPDYWIQHAWLTDLLDLMHERPQSGDGVDVFRAVNAIGDPGIVTIAAIDGSTAGGGCELGWACDLRVAGAGATFAQIEVQLGLTPGLGGASRLLHLIGPTAAAELVLDGRPVGAERMLTLGGVNRVVPAGTARDVAVEWATLIAARPPAALRAAKQILRDAENLTLHDALRNEQTIFQTTLTGAVDRMAAAQARFDEGRSFDAVYGPPVT